MITVFTPTYNRIHTLDKLYNSLLKQTYVDFEWLIVDDGSTDNTEELIHKWKEENRIKIRYYKQQNGGKHRAINLGVELAEREFFFIVDSDDFLLENSLKTVSDYSSRLKENIVGFAGRRSYGNGKLIGQKFPNKEFISNHIEKNYRLNHKGDLAEVFKTEILKKYKFPDFLGEKFCAEGLIWNRVANDGYKILFTNIPIYVTEYLDGGLTDNSIKNRRKSPTYATLLYKELAETKNLPVIQKLRAYTNYWRFTFFTQRSFNENLKFINYKTLGILSIPLGWMMKLKDNNKC